MKLEKKKIEFKTIKVSKFNVLTETKDSILLKINKYNKVWISKKYVYASVYTMNLNLSLVDEWEYNGYSYDKDTKTFIDDKVLGKDLIAYFTPENSDENTDTIEWDDEVAGDK